MCVCATPHHSCAMSQLKAFARDLLFAFYALAAAILRKRGSTSRSRVFSCFLVFFFDTNVANEFFPGHIFMHSNALRG